MHTGSPCSKSQSVTLLLFMLSIFHTYFIWKFCEIIFTYAQILNVCKVTGKESKYGIINIMNSGILIFKQTLGKAICFGLSRGLKNQG